MLYKKIAGFAALAAVLFGNAYQAQALSIGVGGGSRHGGGYVGFGVGPRTYVNTYDYDTPTTYVNTYDYDNESCSDRCYRLYGTDYTDGTRRCVTWDCERCRRRCGYVSTTTYVEPTYVTPRIGIGFGGGFGRRHWRHHGGRYYRHGGGHHRRR